MSNRHAEIAAKNSRHAASAAETESLDTLLGSVNASSDTARNAWLAFLVLNVYLMITISGVSHADLLLNSSVVLPLINVTIPLFSFFSIAPFMLVLVHLGLLVQHIVLANKLSHFSAQVSSREHDGQRNHPIRRNLTGYVFTQIMAGSKPPRAVRQLMGLMVFVTFIALPIALLVYFQIKFLPYHDVGVTHLHRFAITLEVVLLFVASPMIANPYFRKANTRMISLGSNEWPWEISYRNLGISVFISLSVLFFIGFVATVPQGCFFPSEKHIDDCFSLDRMAAKWAPRSVKYEYNHPSREVFALTVLLFEGKVNVWDEAVPSTGFFDRNLLVTDIDLVSDIEDEFKETSISLRDRDLRFAILDRSDLHRVDLTNADLKWSSMRGSKLQEADLRDAELQGAILRDARLQGADLRGADLQGADLSFAELQDAHLRGVELQDAHLRGANLQGADLRGAKLQGADLEDAKLQGDDLSHARLQGANLKNAELQGATMWAVGLQGADLSSANLQGADLRQANLQGAILNYAILGGADMENAELQRADLKNASLSGANLRRAKLLGAILNYASLEGADLSSANLQGADLRGAKLQGADLRRAYLQGADMENAELQGADLRHTSIWQTTPPHEKAFELVDLADATISLPTDDDRKSLQKLIDSEKDTVWGTNIKARLEPLLSPKTKGWGDKKPAQVWQKKKRITPNPDDLSIYLANLVCEKGSGYIAKKITHRALRLDYKGSRKKYSRKVSGKKCWVATELDYSTKKRLCESAYWSRAEIEKTFCIY